MFSLMNLFNIRLNNKQIVLALYEFFGFVASFLNIKQPTLTSVMDSKYASTDRLLLIAINKAIAILTLNGSSQTITEAPKVAAAPTLLVSA